MKLHVENSEIECRRDGLPFKFTSDSLRECKIGSVEISSRFRLLFSLMTVSVLFALRPLYHTFRLAIGHDEFTYVLLILPVSLVFIVIDWKLVASFAKTEKIAGSAILAAAALIAVSTIILSPQIAPSARLSLRIFSIMTWGIGSFVLCFGLRVARALLFPLCFLYAAVPLPDFAMNAIVRLLQQGSAFAAWLLFQAAGVPVFQDGLLLSIPGLTVQVAKECSSIRSSLMLLVTTVVLAQLFLRSPLRKTFAVAIAIPLSVAKNGLRIFTIAMLGTRVDPGFLTGKLHHQGGIVFFAVSLAIVVVLVWWLERGERQSFRASPINALVSC